MDNKQNNLPPIVWLRVTDYMQGWIVNELGGDVTVGDRRVICVHGLAGVKKVMRMESKEDRISERHVIGGSMSATRRNCMVAGMEIDPDVMMKDYGLSQADLSQFIPIECPEKCITKNGVLRPWTNDVTFSKRQAREMLELLRVEFWRAVAQFDLEYRMLLEGHPYPAVEMIEAFCRETGTSEVYVEAIRREWQRRGKRNRLLGIIRAATRL